MTPNQSAATNRRPAGQSDDAGNLAAIVAANRAFLALLGICSRTIKARWKGVKRSYRLLTPYPATPHTFGEHLRKRRLDKGLTQAEVAELVSVSKGSIDKWERNKTKPPVRYHTAIAGFLGFNPFRGDCGPTAR